MDACQFHGPKSRVIDANGRELKVVGGVFDEYPRASHFPLTIRPASSGDLGVGKPFTSEVSHASVKLDLASTMPSTSPTVVTPSPRG